MPEKDRRILLFLIPQVKLYYRERCIDEREFTGPLVC